MTFRGVGESDPVSLESIAQIPGITGVVSAITDAPVGETWRRESLQDHAERIDKAGLRFNVVESIPVHEDNKLGRPSRDALADNFAESVVNVGKAGGKVICYNFMTVCNWMHA